MVGNTLLHKFYRRPFVRVLHLGRQLSSQKTENKIRQVFPFVVLKPTQGSGFSRSVPQQRKKHAFRTQHRTAATNPRLTARGS